MQTVLYARVSTVDQTIEHQQKQAEAAGFKFDRVLSDHGVSGVKTCLHERPEGKRLFDILRSGDILVVRWVDRLGRNYDDVRQAIEEFMRRGVVIRTIINNMTFDGSTSDPMQKAVRDALIGFMAAAAQSHAEVTKAAQIAGIAHAKSLPDGKRYKGRKPSYTESQLDQVMNLADQKAGVSSIAKVTGLSRQAVYRIVDDPTAARASLIEWGSARS
ncbi:recombinase family protein [Bosea sp. 47.2.35]|uniref:recombinase family protein n=1 Tax=Bosea sp. 47.2.35 TaxID=2969304 RepID=UPI0021502B1A|nr:recombinase family protein [Bosea sp. 47.2.35]MCR4522517.1 recombinase family protein [Bosea sp. 47.2.35]